MELKPGYKPSEVGVIPEDWEVQFLKEGILLLSGQHVLAQNYNSDGIGVPYITGPSDFENGIIEHTKFTQRPTTICQPKDILLTVKGSGAGSMVVSDAEYCISRQLMALRVTDWDMDYIYFLLLQDSSLIGAAATGLIPGLSRSDILNKRIAIPPLPEQRAIAAALSDIDALTQAMDALIAKKRDLKIAAMQQLLTGKQRLPGFSGEWETKRLEKIAEIAIGRTPSRSISSYWGSGYNWLSISDLKKKVVCESEEQITELATKFMRIIPKGTLLMSFKLSIGRLCFAGCDLFTNEAICSFQQLQANADFLYYVLGETDFSLYGKQAVKGYTLNKESLKVVEVRLPEFKEQIAIAQVLSDMDAELAALEAKRDKTRDLKRGMMQELLTGRTRLVPTNGNSLP